MSVVADLEEYRAEAARFLEALERADYTHHAGLSPDLPIAEIYERHADLFAPEVAAELVAAVPEARGDRARSLRALAVFAADGAIEAAVRQGVEELARTEAALTATVEGRTRAFRELPGLVANTPDRDVRESIETAWLGLVGNELAPRHAEIWTGRHAAARALGATSYRDLFTRIGPADLDGLATQARRFLSDTAEIIDTPLDALLRRGSGIGLAGARPSDWRRASRANHLDDRFAAAQLLPSLEETLAGMGIRLREQENIVLDIGPRPGKANRAFCSPVVPPTEVYLVISPIGGFDDYSSLFHEAGHAEHFAGMGRNLPFEFRCLGDNAVTETFAFLFEGLLHDRTWLADVLGRRDTDDVQRHVGTSRLYFHRRYCAKVLYELEVHDAPDPTALEGRYVELMSEATRLPAYGARALEDIDTGFYVAAYLRAWVLECHLRDHLRERFGSRWYRSREAGMLLRELWEDGQRLTAEELASELGLPALDLAVLAEDDASLVS